jgi:hypothetical protein
VRTNTSLATMEAANEAARRAVNAIIDAYVRDHGPTASEIDETPCAIWNFHCPWLLWPLRRADKKRYLRGLPWQGHQPWWLRVALWVAEAMLRRIDAANRWAKRRRLTRAPLDVRDIGVWQATKAVRWAKRVTRPRAVGRMLYTPVSKFRWFGRS